MIDLDELKEIQNKNYPFQRSRMRTHSGSFCEDPCFFPNICFYLDFFVI